MIYFESEYLTVYWQEKENFVLMVWQREAETKELKQGLEKGLELVQKQRATKWLADVNKLGIISVPNQNWVNEEWFPRVIKAGIRTMAIVMPKSAIAGLSIRNTMNKVAGVQIETYYFDNLSQAKTWLTAHA